MGLARQCGPSYGKWGSTANCSDPSRGGITRGLSCAEAPGQQRVVRDRQGNNRIVGPCDAGGADGLMSTLYCLCSSSEWNGGDWRPNQTCAGSGLHASRIHV